MKNPEPAMAQAQKFIPPPATESASNPAPNRILIVDDEEASRELCRDFLEADGYTIETSSSVEEALDMLGSQRFDLVISDLSMPGLSGIDLVKKVRYSYPHTSIILLTAFGSVMTAVESMRAGAYDYITKPFPRDLLRATVRRCLESHNLKREITKMQHELFKKDKLAAVGSMAGAIAHRMRNPLSIIQMCAQYLVPRVGKNPEYGQVLQAIQDKVKTLEMLTRDFVEYSRASRIRKSLQSLEKLTDEVLRNVEPRCRIQRVRVYRQYQPDLPLLFVDADLIKEVISNLIDNGLDAMKGEGKIGVSIAKDKTNPYVHLSITNTGSVLPLELQDKIFEPFFTTKPTGMGLGLAIVRQVIEGHGGRIQAMGNSSNQTTTFHIFLPLEIKGEPT